MYSQNDEEQFICKFFGKQTGRLLDIGAFDGIGMSNTRRLMELGWEGVFVEPKWTNFELLRHNCQGLKATLVCAAVSDANRLARLWVDKHPGRLWSTTINKDLLGIGSVMQPSEQVTLVPCITMADLWPLGPYDFISMDAEWEDFAILKSQTPAMWRGVRLMCVEKRGPEEGKQMKDFFAKIGFVLGYETKENLIMQRQLYD